MCENGQVADFPVPEVDPYLVERAHHTFHVSQLTAADFVDNRPHAIIGMVDGEITTTDCGYTDRIDAEYDILKIAVIERHKNTHHIGLGYIKGYGLKHGAVATSISHDSHNIIVVGANDEDMAFAANQVVALNGGIVVAQDGAVTGEVPLAVAGIMSDEPLVEVNRKLEEAKEKAFAAGVNRNIDPFMTLSFMALPVIPTLRITTRGVFDVTPRSGISNNWHEIQHPRCPSGSGGACVQYDCGERRDGLFRFVVRFRLHGGELRLGLRQNLAVMLGGQRRFIELGEHVRTAQHGALIALLFRQSATLP